MKTVLAAISIALALLIMPAAALANNSGEGTDTSNLPSTPGATISTCGGGLAIITCGIPGCDFQTGKLTPKCITNFILHVIQILFALAGVLSLIMIMVGGYMYAASQFIGKSPDEAINVIRNAILGVLLAIFSFMIISFVIDAVS